MKSCCESMEYLMESKGEKGFCVLAFKENHRRKFVLQYRGFTGEDWELIIRKDLCNDMPSVSFNKLGSIVILHCPYCGINLKKVIKLDEVNFDKLAKVDKIFFQ